MTENLAQVGARHVDEVRQVHRQLIERALHMRCLGYLAQVKARLLTETLFEIDQSKKHLLSAHQEMTQQQAFIAQQKDGLERTNQTLRQIQGELEQRVAARTADLLQTNRVLQQEIEDRKEAEVRLQDSEQRFRELLETAPDAMVIIKETGEIVLANRQVERLFGYPRKALMGQPIEKLLPKALHGNHRRHREQYLRQPAIRPMSERRDLYGQHKDGATIPLEISLSPLRTGDGLLISTAIRDISEHKRLENELCRYRDHLEALVAERTAALTIANEELERFSYSVSHDLRTPLRAIDGFSQALVDDYGNILDERAKSHLQRVRNAAQRMGWLIDDLLQLSRISRGKLKRERVNMSAMAKDAVKLLQETQPERLVDSKIAPGLKVYADKGLLRAMLDNLFDNAWKFTATQEHAHVEFGALKQDGQRVFYIRDNGVGFDMRHADQLFGAFQRLHRQAEFDGTGIGLATVQRIIHRHGGDIWAESAPGEGATFYFTLHDSPSDAK